jgi:hypothetical protein
MAKRQPIDREPTGRKVGRQRLRPSVRPQAAGQQRIIVRLFWD